jgi:hypothetical protein
MSEENEMLPPPGTGNWHWVQTRPEIGDQIELAGWEPSSGEWIIYAEEGAWRFTAAEARFDGWKHLAAVPTPEEIWGWKARAADYDRALKAERDANAIAHALLGALRPFADAAEELDLWHRDKAHIWETSAAMAIDAGHLRAARAAIALAEGRAS